MSVEDRLRRWEVASTREWAPTSSSCADCGVAFRTGTVSIVFGDLSVSIARVEYCCEQCGYSRILGGAPPSATALFVEPDHRVTRESYLPPDVRVRVQEAFEIIDALHEKMAEIVARHGGLGPVGEA